MTGLIELESVALAFVCYLIVGNEAGAGLAMKAVTGGETTAGIPIVGGGGSHGVK